MKGRSGGFDPTESQRELLTEAALQLRVLLLHRLQLPLQHLDLALLPGDLHMQERAFVIDQFGDVRHRRLQQHLHYGGELRLEGDARRHVHS